MHSGASLWPALGEGLELGAHSWEDSACVGGHKAFRILGGTRGAGEGHRPQPGSVGEAL